MHCAKPFRQLATHCNRPLAESGRTRGRNREAPAAAGGPAAGIRGAGQRRGQVVSATGGGPAAGIRGAGRWRDQDGSGAAIGVAMMFPALMLVIVSLSLLTGSARMEQALQSTANRVARIASLCCHHTGGDRGAVAVAHAALEAAGHAAATNRVVCNNDLVGDSAIGFTNVDGNDVAIAEDSAVPPGGQVHVVLTCHIPPEVMGGVGIPGLDVRRTAVGVASVDPFRSRSGG